MRVISSLGAAGALGAATFTVVTTSIGVLIVPRPPCFPGVAPQGRLSDAASCQVAAPIADRSAALTSLSRELLPCSRRHPCWKQQATAQTLSMGNGRVCDGRHTTYLKLSVANIAQTRNLRHNSVVSLNDVTYGSPIIGLAQLSHCTLNAPRHQPVPDNLPVPPETAPAPAQRCPGCTQSSTRSL